MASPLFLQLLRLRTDQAQTKGQTKKVKSAHIYYEKMEDKNYYVLKNQESVQETNRTEIFVTIRQSNKWD
jgi:hypothetical protein